MSRRLTFAYPGDLDLKTGGYGYDRKVISGLLALGWEVDLLSLGEGFPNPSAENKAKAEESLSVLADGALVVIDGLAFGVLDEWAEREASRLKIVALVHHPLALETGLGPSQRSRFEESERRALRSAGRIIVTSAGTSRELIAGFGVDEKAITVAHPGTEPAKVSKCDGIPPKIIAVGSLIPRKGYDILLAALKQVKDLPWNAIIVGSADLHPQTAVGLARQVKSLQLSERVVMLGQQDDPRALMAKADIFALASRYEGYGMVFAEALSQGLPIVACRAGAIPDVVPEDAGFLVPPDDADAFAEALRALLADRALLVRKAAAARHAGVALPGWNETAQIISGALESCL